MIKNPLEHKQERGSQKTSDVKRRKFEVGRESSLTSRKSLKFLNLCKKSSCKMFKEKFFFPNQVLYIFCVSLTKIFNQKFYFTLVNFLISYFFVKIK